MSGALPPLPQHALMACCSVKAQGQIYLYLLQIIIMSLHSYGCETRSLTLKKEYKLQVLQNKVRREMFRTKKDKANEWLGMLHN
jgi:hypothetical protein